MRRVRYHAHGGPEVLVTEEAEVPAPGPGQVLIRTEAIGVNYVDVQLRRATDPGSLHYRELPGTLTGDVVGTVEAVGPGADPALAGTRVAVLLVDAYADYVAGRHRLARPRARGTRPGRRQHAPDRRAVALGVLRAGRLAKGRLCWSPRARAASGTSRCNWPGSGRRLVVATAGSAAKLEFLAGIGADVTVDHSQPDWADQVPATISGRVDVAFDAVGGAVLHAGVGLLKPLGRAASTAPPAVIRQHSVRSLFGLKSVTGFGLLMWRQRPPSRPGPISPSWPACRAGELRPVTQSLPLTEAVEAHRMLEGRSFPGRLLLVP